MGFADRRYSPPDRSWRGSSPGPGDWSAVTTIVVVNCAVWIACRVAGIVGNESDAAGSWLDRLLSLSSVPSKDVWQPWRFVTYGFTHSATSPFHLGFNMLAVWFFGPEVEERLGRGEFYRFWFTAVVVSGVAWLASANLGPAGMVSTLVGASGAVMATLAVFIWHNPHQELLLWGILPIPAWALGILYFFSDVNGAYHHSGNVAHVAHIGGALFGLAYAWRGWHLGDLLEVPGRLLQSRSRFRIVRPDDPPPPRPTSRQAPERFGPVSTPRSDDGATTGLDADLHEAVDRILEKISRSGEASLTPEERETLTHASRRLKDRLR